VEGIKTFQIKEKEGLSMDKNLEAGIYRIKNLNYQQKDIFIDYCNNSLMLELEEFLEIITNKENFNELIIKRDDFIGISISFRFYSVNLSIKALKKLYSLNTKKLFVRVNDDIDYNGYYYTELSIFITDTKRTKILKFLNKIIDIVKNEGILIYNKEKEDKTKKEIIL
jgi:hypothetical protein